METRNCQNCNKDFILEVDDLSFYEKIKVPSPTWCPECRSIRRMSWRNDYCFYKRKCDLCFDNTLSIYSPDKTLPIYCSNCWWKDGWDPFSYGQKYDSSKPFFSQFKDLLDKVPALAILNDNGSGSINCEYTNYFARGKDCYLTDNSWKVENALYSSCLVGGKDIVDCIGLQDNCNHIYSSINLDNSYKCKNVYRSSTMTDCAYCFDCKGCTNCFMCVDLRNKQYCFKNIQYTKEEYMEIVKGYKFDCATSLPKIEKEFEEFRLTLPHRFASLKNCVDCTGDYLVNSKNSQNCFIVVRAENTKYFERGDTVKDSYDCLSGGEQELCYECINPDNSNRTCFTMYCHKDTNVYYSDSCQSCEDIFGCVGLKSAKYCIFNIQYEKTEYFKLRDQIISDMKELGEWGEFFPTELSKFSYNETIAQEQYPLTKDQALKKGYTWQDSLPLTTGLETIQEIPDSINDVSDSFTKEIMKCEDCSRNYQIIPSELQFYKFNQIPIPRLCFFCRKQNLLQKRGPTKLWKRSCMCEKSNHSHTAKCQNEFETSYDPERPEILYCESCYQQEVV